MVKIDLKQQLLCMATLHVWFLLILVNVPGVPD